MNKDWNDEQIAEALATEAGKILLDLQRSGDFTGKALGKVGDEAANKYLMAELASVRPDDAFLSEEEKDDHARLSANRVWIIDPLDGTREYSEGRDDWAVHVALAINSIPKVGAVALPGLGRTLTSGKPTQLPEANTPPKMLVSRTRPAKEAVAVAETMGAELLPMGSAGAKAMAVVRGEADIYLHSGGQYEWDNCAPVAVAMAAEFHCSRIDGAEIVYNQADPYLPDLLICRKELANQALELVAAMDQ
ncbi:MAG: 3'(2'),5'-bisphosphate nucleotidase CysQ [Parasphingorhabdus sp.]